MFDIKKIEEEAAKELAEEKAKAAKSKIKDSLNKISAAERVLQNLRDEHAVILRDIGA
jgi:predicted transcriptional regulator